MIRPLAVFIALMTAHPVSPAGAGAFEAQETTYHSGSLEIAATLLVPAGAEHSPGVVLIQGSGASSRKNAWARAIGEGLAGRGLVVFLPDKRGTGDSEGDWKTVGFAALAQDIAAAEDFLRQRPETDARAVGVVGLSQGGFYAPMVAVQSPATAFVGAVSASTLPLDVTVNHEMRNTFRDNGLSGAAHRQAMELQFAAMQYARDGNWAAYDSVRTRVLEGPAAEAAEGFSSDPDSWLWSWVAGVVDFDPMVYWRQVQCPMFFAYGEMDEHENVPVIRSVERIQGELERKGVEVWVYPESGHALYDPEALDQGRYLIREDFLNDLHRWILAATR